MVERHRSGTPRASDHWNYSDRSRREPLEEKQFGPASRDGKKQSKERKIFTDYQQCSDCGWTISVNEQYYFQALKKFQVHNREEHNGSTHAHLVKR